MRILLAIAAAAALGLAACTQAETDNAAEEAGAAIEEAADTAGEAATEAGEAVEGAVNDAATEVQNATDDNPGRGRPLRAQQRFELLVRRRHRRR